MQVMMNTFLFTVEAKGDINDPTTLILRQRIIHNGHKLPY